MTPEVRRIATSMFSRHTWTTYGGCTCGFSRRGWTYAQHMTNVIRVLLDDAGACDDCYGGGNDLCDDCDGTGDRGRGQCRACDGNGVIDCPTCGGIGLLPKDWYGSAAS